MNITEAAETLGIPRSTIYTMINDGRLHAKKNKVDKWDISLASVQEMQVQRAETDIPLTVSEVQAKLAKDEQDYLQNIKIASEHFQEAYNANASVHELDIHLEALTSSIQSYKNIRDFTNYINNVEGRK